MSNSIKNITKGLVAGAAVGAAVGIALISMTKPKPKIQRNASHALNTISNVMQNMADMLG